jgi:hypothetical protein
MLLLVPGWRLAPAANLYERRQDPGLFTWGQLDLKSMLTPHTWRYVHASPSLHWGDYLVHRNRKTVGKRVKRRTQRDREQTNGVVFSRHGKQRRRRKAGDSRATAARSFNRSTAERTRGVLLYDHVIYICCLPGVIFAPFVWNTLPCLFGKPCQSKYPRTALKNMSESSQQFIGHIL